MLPCGAEFRVWAPKAKKLEVVLKAEWGERLFPLREGEKGYFTGIIPEAVSGNRYMYRIDGALDRPDPASMFQPEGVHGPSQLVDPRGYEWRNPVWHAPALSDYIIYELHVGTFTPEGTFEAVIGKIPYLLELGVTAVELMPVVQFPGDRNWGYDGVFPYAPHNGYGGPEGLKRLVDACHGAGLAVIIDVVYNHLGPEGNYLRDFGFYFTDHYRTPWGDAINFDGPWSDEVRAYFIDNALYWITEFRADALRLDAVHGIYDFGARHFLRELARAVRKEGESSGRRAYLIAESDLNDVRLITEPQRGGYGLDAQWLDDYHHAVHSILTGERDGYYQDYGVEKQLVAALQENYIYSGQYSMARKRRHGNSAAESPSKSFVVFSQNHDQVGNRMLGERLSSLISFESLKLTAGLIILSPFIPLLFMGEEYGENNPFLYFVNHTDQELVAAVRAGRREEFNDFAYRGEPPDPEDMATFEASKLDWRRRTGGSNLTLYRFYQRLIGLRKSVLPLRPESGREAELVGDGLVLLKRRSGREEAICLFNLAEQDREAEWRLPGGWVKLLDSSGEEWGGTGKVLPDQLGPGRFVMRGRSCGVFQSHDRPISGM
ncbi:maltooligosyl trehalose hydrolase [Geobacter sp. DSM 9736]|nr:maltooligosyl trehalose hydrolase [Geobacter sp. DSM 9736]